jgi:hypothetical protein
LPCLEHLALSLWTMPMKVRWIQSPPPPCLHLVPIGFGFGISFVHIRNFFIAIDVLLQKKPFQCEQPCLLVLGLPPGP